MLAWLTAPDRNGVQGAMARRFGIMYIIHNRKMWRSYAPERGWAPYYGISPHTDHIHFSFNYNGAAGRTSWWTGVAARTVLTTLPPAGTTLPTTPTTPPTPTPTTPVPTTPVVLSFGMTSAAVKTLQTRLGGLPVTGYFGSLTKARVIAYQKFVGLPQTGVADLRDAGDPRAPRVAHHHRRLPDPARWHDVDGGQDAADQARQPADHRLLRLPHGGPRHGLPEVRRAASDRRRRPRHPGAALGARLVGHRGPGDDDLPDAALSA